MLSLSDEEFGYKRPMGGLMIPCGENVFLDITSRSLELIGSNPTMIRLT